MARRRLVESFGAELDKLELQNAKLLVSELVANAVVHGRGRIELQAHLDQDRLRVEVIDEGSEFTLAFRERDLGPAGGFGLRIVDAQASSWGIHEGASHVWFELRRRRAASIPREAPPR
jgi:anti-sigma regulatory factor (Ser/Thr protein kinase)